MLARPDAPLVLLAGIVLLVAGRRLFWLFVGVVGFLVGFRLAFELLGPGSEGKHWLVAVAAGLLGVALAFAVQRLAVALAGFFVGLWGASLLFQVNLSHPRPAGILLCVLAGLAAAVLALRVFEGALIVLSSFAGAGMVVDALSLRHALGAAVLVALAILGILVQAGLTARGRPYRDGT
jgi:uncharacterized protein DUF4203